MPRRVVALPLRHRPRLLINRLHRRIRQRIHLLPQQVQLRITK
jgi:hypothetical protein